MVTVNFYTFNKAFIILLQKNVYMTLMNIEILERCNAISFNVLCLVREFINFNGNVEEE